MATLLADGSVTRSREVAAARPVAFVLIAFALSWSAVIGGWWLAGRPADMRAPGMVPAIYLSAFGPGVAGALLAWREGRLRHWAGAFLRWRAGWRAYAMLVALPLVVVAIMAALGYAPRPGASGGMPAVFFWLTLFPVSLFNGLATAALGAGPLGEEGGWRGYLLPALLARMGEARASLLIGLVWAVWHLPIMLLFAGWRDGLPFGFYLPVYIFGVTGLSFLMTRIWRAGRGNLIPCIWLHGLVNAIGGTAFNGQLWSSGWLAEWSPVFAGCAFWIAAGVVWALTRRSALR